MAAAVPLAGEVVMDVAAQMGLKLCVGSALLPTVTDVHIWVFRDTNLASIIPTVIKEKLLFRRDVPRGAEVHFSIVGISYQILLFPIPGSAYKHHPVTLVFISCNDVELQDAIVVHLPNVIGCLVCPICYFQRVTLLPNQRSKASPHRNGLPSPHTYFRSHDRLPENKLFWERKSGSALYWGVRNESYRPMIWAV